MRAPIPFEVAIVNARSTSINLKRARSEGLMLTGSAMVANHSRDKDL